VTCRELVELVTAYFEGALPEEERAAFDEHLAVCPGCVRYVEQLRTTIRVVGDADRLGDSPEVGVLLGAFRDWKRARPTTG
jgi:anti-sigma factor RsiW